MRDGDAAGYEGAGLRRHGCLLFHVVRILVVSQALERRMTDAAIPGPLGEGDLAQQDGFDPADRLPFTRAEAGFGASAVSDRVLQSGRQIPGPLHRETRANLAARAPFFRYPR
jgi:hypothetical protein